MRSSGTARLTCLATHNLRFPSWTHAWMSIISYNRANITAHLSHSDGDGLPGYARQPVENMAVKAGRHDDAAVPSAHGRVRQHVDASRRQQSNDALRSITCMAVACKTGLQPSVGDCHATHF